jgi:hypothetical protein
MRINMRASFGKPSAFVRRLRNRAGQFAGSFGRGAKSQNVRRPFGMRGRRMSAKARAIGMGAYSAFRGSTAARRFGAMPTRLKVAAGIVGGVGLAGVAVKSWLEQRKSS